ncbi:hypothetical protein EQH57_0123 [Dictyocoela roeselum]|nr:hypothetical protein EQH57_0123 [Dictyocoela roeselum]
MVTEDELHTVLCQLEAVLNCLLLTSISDSVDDYQPLTPRVARQWPHWTWRKGQIPPEEESNPSQLILDSAPLATLDPDEVSDPSTFTAELLSRRQKNAQKVLHRFQTRFRN